MTLQRIQIQGCPFCVHGEAGRPFFVWPKELEEAEGCINCESCDAHLYPVGSKEAKKQEAKGHLFMGVFPTGISYCDKSKEKDGDFLQIARLSFDTLTLEWSGPVVSLEMKVLILQDAKRFWGLQGTRYPVTSSGNSSVILGGPTHPRDCIKELLPLFDDFMATHRVSSQTDEVLMRDAKIAIERARVSVMYYRGSWRAE